MVMPDAARSSSHCQQKRQRQGENDPPGLRVEKDSHAPQVHPKGNPEAQLYVRRSAPVIGCNFLLPRSNPLGGRFQHSFRKSHAALDSLAQRALDFFLAIPQRK